MYFYCFTYACMCLCGSMCTWVQVGRAEKTVSEPQELELQFKPNTWVLGTTLGSLKSSAGYSALGHPSSPLHWASETQVFNYNTILPLIPKEAPSHSISSLMDILCVSLNKGYFSHFILFWKDNTIKLPKEHTSLLHCTQLIQTLNFF